DGCARRGGTVEGARAEEVEAVRLGPAVAGSVGVAERLLERLRGLRVLVLVRVDEAQRVERSGLDVGVAERLSDNQRLLGRSEQQLVPVRREQRRDEAELDLRERLHGTLARCGGSFAGPAEH